MQMTIHLKFDPPLPVVGEHASMGTAEELKFNLPSKSLLKMAFTFIYATILRKKTIWIKLNGR